MKILELGDEKQRFYAQSEAKMLETLSHPNIVKNYETFIEDKKLHIVMEYCENGNLKMSPKYS